MPYERCLEKAKLQILVHFCTDWAMKFKKKLKSGFKICV